jgi:hypothetical protein
MAYEMLLSSFVIVNGTKVLKNDGRSCWALVFKGSIKFSIDFSSMVNSSYKYGCIGIY